MNNPPVWALIWLVFAVLTAGGEILTVGTFFLLPFAAGALAASIASLFGAPLLWSWIIFLVVSFVSFLAIKPFAKYFDRKVPDAKGLGANRMIDSTGIVIEAIPDKTGQAGLVKVGANTWRAESATSDEIPEGATVTVKSIKGTRLIVVPETNETEI
jgi:membrane protein implicated in regulation of membrane protease activity